MIGYDLVDELAQWLPRLVRSISLAFQQRLSRRGLKLLEWGRRFLPAHFSRPSSRMHLWLAERLDQCDTSRGQRLNVIGPRGSAKSTLGTLAYVARAAVEGREHYIWIISDTRHQACTHLENVRAELIGNHLLMRAYPLATGDRVRHRAGQIVLPNGVTIEAYGTGQRIRGRRRRHNRPTLIVCDDLQNDQHMVSALARERSWSWFTGTLLAAGTPSTNVVNLATALHRDAIAPRLGRTSGWTSRVFVAIERWPDHQVLWNEWEAIYCDLEVPDRAARARSYYETHRDPMDAGSVLLWPEVEDLYTLLRMRVDNGPAAFAREKQGQPYNPESCEWPEEYFGDWIWFGQWPADIVLKTMALDPSKGRDARRGDYSAFVLVGIDGQGVIHVQADLARRPTTEIVTDAVALVRSFVPHVFGVEANQFQELLADELASELSRQGLATVPCPIVNKLNKIVRIRRLGPYLAARRLRFLRNNRGTRLLVEQLADFPQADHDDGPDALEMAIRLAEELAAGLNDESATAAPPWKIWE